MRKKTFRPPVHPGRILKEDLLEPLGISVNRLAGALKVPANRINQVVNGRRAISADTSIRLGRYFGFSLQYWHNLQKHYEFELIRRACQTAIERNVRPRQAA